MKNDSYVLDVLEHNKMTEDEREAIDIESGAKRPKTRKSIEDRKLELELRAELGDDDLTTAERQSIFSRFD